VLIQWLSSHLSQKKMICFSNPFLADRTNGHTIATLLRPSSSVTLCIVAKRYVRPRAKVTIESL